MFKRCYELNHPTYKGCSVDECWHSFQKFGDWYEDKWEEWMDNTWHLDKDILLKGNKVYSPETCCFVPREVNNFFEKSNSIRGEYPIGVTIDKRRNKFIAQISQNNKINKFLGYFNTVEEAFQSYKITKESYAKELVDKWKDKIEIQALVAIYNYKVEITD